MTRKLVVFDNIAIGPIAIGNVAVGYVAIGFTIAIGPIAIGMNALGVILAVGLNSLGVISIGGINAVGTATLAGVNALGVFAASLVNHGVSVVPGLLFAMAEGAGAMSIWLSFEERPRELDGAAFVSCRAVDDRGLLLVDGKFLPWAESVEADHRAVTARELAEAPDALVRVRLNELERRHEGDGYRTAGTIETSLECVVAQVLPRKRWYLPTFRRALTFGAALSLCLTIVAVLR